MRNPVEDRKILAYTQRHPELTQAQIGEHFGRAQAFISHRLLDAGFSRTARKEQCRFWAKHRDLEKKVVELLKRNPDVGYRTIGQMVGLDYDSVWWVANQNGLAGIANHSRSRGNHNAMSEKTRAAIRAGYARWLEKKKLSLTDVP